MAESSGIPVPGETALIRPAIEASQGGLQIELVVAIAALAAIISGRFGRTLLERPGLLERRRRRVLEIGEPFFERHGPKAVFFGRWTLGLRTWRPGPPVRARCPGGPSPSGTPRARSAGRRR